MKELQIISKTNMLGDEWPYGIRDRSGFLFFFTSPQKFGDQEERYQRDLAKKHALANRLLEFLIDTEKP